MCEGLARIDTGSYLLRPSGPPPSGLPACVLVPCAAAVPVNERNVGGQGYGFAMAIARYPSIVLDCPDPVALATFYGTMLDWKVTTNSAGWAEVRADYGQCISFQPVEDYQPPQWPGQAIPQQMHLDVIVDDLDNAEAAVIELGAVRHESQPGRTFRVFLDPAGHPFCLCVS
jgi:hypothetical protein